MTQDSFDVIIVGAGAAGLMAAWEIIQTGRTVAVVEARDRVGGRVHTITDNKFSMPVEMGAEFVHGNLPLTEMLLKKAGVEYYKIGGSFWQNEDGELNEQNDFIEDYSALNKKFKELKQDVNVAAFIEDHLQGKEFEELRFTLKNYVEGYYAADAGKASTFSLREELNSSDDVQYRIEGGYVKLINYLYEQCKERGTSFFLSNPVQQVEWQKDKVTVVSRSKTLSAKKVLITVPVGVLQSDAIRFSPSLAEKMNAAKQLGYGPVIKTILQFNEAFWKDEAFTQGKNLSKMSFIFSRAVIPTWWTQYPKDVAILTGWSGGPHAEEIKDLGDDEILQQALQSLGEIFSIDVQVLEQKLKAWHVANWIKDPNSCGAYSYEVVNGSAIKEVMKEPAEHTVYFAGEGLFDGPEIGTVEAALSTGRETAHRMIAAFKK
jgi:monoamine oxidase